MSRHSNTRISGCIFVLTLLASCNAAFEGDTIAAPATTPAPLADIDNYAQSFLNGIQQISFAESREFCGFFVTTDDGRVVGTPPRAGTADSCMAGFIPQNAVASYHTHGGYLRNYFNEVPSINDANSAIDVELDDYVSTPGGRFWRVDGVTGASTALCGRGCLAQDPIFEPDWRNPIGNRYTLDELRDLQG